MSDHVHTVGDDEEKRSMHSSSSPAKEQPLREPAVGREHDDVVRTTAGVERMEAIARAATETKSGKQTLYIIGTCVWIMYFVYSMQSSSTYAYSVFAVSSFASHSAGIATLGIATSIISAVSKPFIAKLSDVFTRPYMFILVMVSYVVGFIMIMKSPNLATYIVGSVFVSVGSSGLDLLTTILAADLVPLSYRGLAFGLLSSPYIVVPWFTAEIVAAFSKDEKWRWGYGMFAIIIPCVMAPAIGTMIYLDRRAHKLGIINAASSSEARRLAKEHAEANANVTGVLELNGPLMAVEIPKTPLFQRVKQVFFELDTPGLLLLGFGWSLLLLPFSLASVADGGYANRSLIAMFVVGALSLIVYAVYEWRWAEFPTAPIRLMKNRTFLCSVVIDWFYMFAGYIQSTYLSSYAYVTTDWTTQEWTYYGNTLTVSLCLFGVVAGLIMRFTHRYKLMQVLGLVIKMIAYAILVDKSGAHDTARLVISQVLVGLGGSFSVVASQVAAQASVPHQDVALSISLLSLWSSIGAAIGNAVAGAMWENSMPTNLRQYLPASVNDTQVATFYGDITTIKAYPFDSEIRLGAIEAYDATVYPMFAVALALSFIPILAACWQTNYYLDERQNAYDGKGTDGEVVGDREHDQPKQDQGTRTTWQKVLRIWDQ